MRLKYKPWATDYIKSNKQLFIQGEEDLYEYIKDAKTVKVEIGCGKGQFIRTLAKQNPDVCYIAVERYETVIVTAAKELEDEPLANLKFYACDISKFNEYSNIFHAVDTIYLNFSDPWPKKRHTKRRLTYSSFLNIYDTMLKPGGHIEFKTDNQALFEYSLSSLSHNRWNLDNISLDLHNTERENIKTEYEIKFSNLGFRICYLEARKDKNE